MRLRDGIGAHFPESAPDERVRWSQLLDELLAAFEAGGADAVTERLVARAREFDRAGQTLIAALRRKLSPDSA